MAGPQVIRPVVGNWFEGRYGLFEVVAVDESDGTIEIQHLDGSLEELELDDWTLRCKAGALQVAEQPEDYTGAIDIEPDDEPLPGSGGTQWVDGMMNARGLEGLDLFE